MPPMRRPLGSSVPGYNAGPTPSAMPAGMGNSPMAPRPAMTGAPANNPGAGRPGPQSGAMGGMMGVPVAPRLPLQPGAGGPTAPANVGPMLMNAQGQQPGMGQPARQPLQPWGTQGGNTGMGPSGGPRPNASAPGQGTDLLAGTGMGTPPGQGPGAGATPQAGAMNPSVLIKLLRASGHI